MNENLEALQSEAAIETDKQPEVEGKLESTKHLFVINVIEKLLARAKSHLPQRFFVENVSRLVKIGHYCVLICAALGVVAGILSSFTISRIEPIFYGLGWMLALFVFQFVAHKFLEVGETLIETTESRMSSTSFLDSVSLLNIILGLLCLMGGLFSAITTGEIETAILGVIMFCIFEYSASLSMFPKMLNIHVVEKTTAGQEAIGLISFYMKGMLKLLPVYFGMSMAIGTLNMVGSIAVLLDGRTRAFMAHGSTASYLIFSALLAPFVAYLVFMSYYLALDVIRAILDLPSQKRVV